MGNCSQSKGEAKGADKAQPPPLKEKVKDSDIKVIMQDYLEAPTRTLAI